MDLQACMMVRASSSCSGVDGAVNMAPPVLGYGMDGLRPSTA